MTWTKQTLYMKDGNGALQAVYAYSDGTAYSFCPSLSDSTGAIINPAVATGSVHLTASPTVTAAQYLSGYNVGGLITLAGAARVSGGSGLIQNVAVTVKTALVAPYDVVFFDTQPTSNTIEDNTAFALNQLTDLPYIVGTSHCTDTTSLGTPQLLQATNLAMPFQLSSGTSLYAAVIIRGTQSFASTSAVNLSVLVKQD